MTNTWRERKRPRSFRDSWTETGWVLCATPPQVGMTRIRIGGKFKMSKRHQQQQKNRIKSIITVQFNTVSISRHQPYITFTLIIHCEFLFTINTSQPLHHRLNLHIICVHLLLSTTLCGNSRQTFFGAYSSLGLAFISFSKIPVWAFPAHLSSTTWVYEHVGIFPSLWSYLCSLFFADHLSSCLLFSWLIRLFFRTDFSLEGWINSWALKEGGLTWYPRDETIKFTSVTLIDDTILSSPRSLLLPSSVFASCCNAPLHRYTSHSLHQQR